jgi:hypothetical protein
LVSAGIVHLNARDAEEFHVLCVAAVAEAFPEEVFHAVVGLQGAVLAGTEGGYE